MLFPLNSGPISKTCTGPQKRTEEGVGFGARKGTWKIIGNLKFASQLNPNSPSWLETTDLSQFPKSPLFEPPTSPADADFGPRNLDLRDWGDRTTNRPETEARLHATGDHQATEVVPPRQGPAPRVPRVPRGFGSRAGGERVAVASGGDGCWVVFFFWDPQQQMWGEASLGSVLDAKLGEKTCRHLSTHVLEHVF